MSRRILILAVSAAFAVGYTLGAALGNPLSGSRSSDQKPEEPRPPAPVSTDHTVTRDNHGFGRYSDEPVRITLEDYVDLVFLLPEDSVHLGRFRQLVYPLIEESLTDRPPDFIRVPRKSLEAVGQIPPQHPEANAKLAAIYGRAFDDTPYRFTRDEWEGRMSSDILRLPHPLLFLHYMQKDYIVVPPDANYVVHTSVGNSDAVVRALQYVHGKRKGLRPPSDVPARVPSLDPKAVYVGGPPPLPPDGTVQLFVNRGKKPN